MFLQTTALLSFAIGAYANIYSLVGTVPWAPGPPSSTDQSAIYNGTYYLSDRTNKGVHVVSLANKTQTGFIAGFVTGLINGTLASAISGPDGVVVLANRNEMYVGDGDGTVKVINLFNNTVVAKIPTGSKKRADEFAYNPSTRTVVVTNANESPPMVNFLNVTSLTVIGNMSFPGAEGLEQPAFNPTDSQFYVSVPQTDGAPGGAIQRLNVNNKANFSIAKTLPLPGCAPAGIVFGPSNKLFIGCSGSQVSTFGYAASYIMDVSTGAIIANISGITGSDQVAYSPKTGYYYASAYLNTVKGVPTPILAVISTNGTVVQKIPTDNVTAHSVAVDENTGTVVVPVKAQGILIYGLGTGSTTSSTSGARVNRLGSLAGVVVAALAFACLL
jgi:hypothetical protein